MTKFIAFVAFFVLTMPAFALSPAGQGRRTMSAQMIAPRQVAAPQVQAKMASAKVTSSTPSNDTGDVNPGASAVPNPGVPDTPTPVVPQINNREKEKAACINNNIGYGNTFVWASRYSNTGDYTTMVEDIENPDNNTCFVRVELKSADPKVKVSDIPVRYFEMGRTVTCGDWADEEMLKKRILDAKKSARTWATVGASVGGAALGVGAMELFGNKAIGGAVEGQYGIEGTELIKSQLAVAKKEDSAKYDSYKEKLGELKAACDAYANLAPNETLQECRYYADLYNNIGSL